MRATYPVAERFAAHPGSLSNGDLRPTLSPFHSALERFRNFTKPSKLSLTGTVPLDVFLKRSISECHSKSGSPLNIFSKKKYYFLVKILFLMIVMLPAAAKSKFSLSSTSSRLQMTDEQLKILITIFIVFHYRLPRPHRHF